MSIKQKPLVAVVGAGYWGKNLVRNFYRLEAVKYVLDDDPDTVKKLKDEFPGLNFADSLDQILNDSDIAGLVLATPAVSHYSLAKKALNAGKHIFVEKPLALSSDQGRELVRIAENSGLVLMVDHLLRNHPAYLKLRELVQSGALGRLRHIHSRRLSFGKIRQEEDVLWSFAPHDLSMILGLTGQMPLAVSSTGGSWISPGLADAVEGRLDFGNGLSANISVSWLNPVKEQRLTVIGDEKMAIFDDTLAWPEKLKIYSHKVAWPEQKPTAIPAPAENIVLEESEPLKAQCLAFLEAISGGREPLTNGAEGLRVLTVLEALSNSLKQNGALTAISETRQYQAHPTAIIDPGVEIGHGCKIWHFTHILSGSKLGEGCNLGQNVVVGPKVTIGRGVKIQNNVSVYEGVTLEDDVFCGPSMVFTNVINPRADIVRKNEYRPTKVKRGASIGANATIVCGHTLGAWSFIGAGAVVTGDVEDQALMVGNPARRVGWVCRCGLKLSDELLCRECGRSYRRAETGLEQITEGERS